MNKLIEINYADDIEEILYRLKFALNEIGVEMKMVAFGERGEIPWETYSLERKEKLNKSLFDKDLR